MQNHLKKTAFVGVMSAMAFVLFLFPKFSLIPGFAWLEFDFSDVPALFASMMISPFAGLAVVFIKNVLHLAVTHTGMIGELSNFLISGAFVFAVGAFYRFLFRKDEKRSSFIGSLALGSAIQLVTAVLVNYYIMIPMYSAFVNFSELGGAEKYILAGVIPFNVLKDLFVSVATVVLLRLLFRNLHAYFHKLFTYQTQNHI